MPKPPKPIKAFKHKGVKRAHIPSAEEAGYESQNPLVQGEQRPREFPLNPIIHRGQDPELFWMHKAPDDAILAERIDTLGAALKKGELGSARQAFEALQMQLQQPANDNDSSRKKEQMLSVDIRSLYRSEHIAPETIIKGLYKMVVAEDAQNPDLTGFSTPELFRNAIGHEELDKVSDYYRHSDGWTNRLIQGDSLLVMNSLLAREGMAGQVQCIYIDPPYGIKYGGNWQIRLNSRAMSESDKDDDLTGEPEQIKAYRDTWELGIHSYLSYLRDRLLVARELLHFSGSCFIQISDENVHLVRSLMDEVFGSDAHIADILVKKKGSQSGEYLPSVNDYVVWYGRAPKDSKATRFRTLFEKRPIDSETLSEFKFAELPDGSIFEVSNAPTPDGQVFDYRLSPKRLFVDYPAARLFRQNPLTSSGIRKNQTGPFEFEGAMFHCGDNNHWKTSLRTEGGSKPGMSVLAELGRLVRGDKQLRFKSYLDDFEYQELSNWWDGLGGASNPVYVVQTNVEIVQRCILMTTDPGDLVLDPTCGSGTAAYVSEKWGRRWLTVDTSRIAINVAKIRLLTAVFPYYLLHDQETCDVRQGFRYKKVAHVTLGSLANREQVKEETLYDRPDQDNKRMRVAGPFTVETLQSYEPISPEELARQRKQDDELSNFEDLVFEHLRNAGVKTGIKDENAVFTRIDRLPHTALHAEGWYTAEGGEKKAYLHIGPKFGSVSKQAVTEAIKACRDRRDADWLLILGFAFETGITELSRSFGSFQVSIVRMHDDLLQLGLLKRDKKAASFVTIGEPDIRLLQALVDGPPSGDFGSYAQVEIAGLDIYDPIKDEVKARDVQDIHYWMLDDRYDGSNFVPRQVFFCGGTKDEFDDWKKGLNKLAEASTRKKAEQTLKLQIDEEAFASLYGHQSRPFPVQSGQKIAVRVVSQFGEETTKVLTAP